MANELIKGSHQVSESRHIFMMNGETIFIDLKDGGFMITSSLGTFNFSTIEQVEEFIKKNSY